MQYVNAFPRQLRILDNAQMHFIDAYKSKQAKALANLCAKKKRGGVCYLLKEEKNGQWRVNANALSRAMDDEKNIDLPQSTISRLLLGQPSKPETIQSLVEFFGVQPAVVRGEVDIESKGKSSSAENRWPFDDLFDDFMKLEDDEQQQIGDAVRALITGLIDRYQSASSPQRRKKSGG